MKNEFKFGSIWGGIVLATALSAFSDTSTSLNDGGSMHIQNSTPDKANKATGLIGMQIRNQQDDRLGKVKDVVLDLQSGRVAYVVLSTGGLAPKYLAVPPSAFSVSDDQKRLILNADFRSILSTPGISKNNWPNMATPIWGAEPFWQAPNGESYQYRNDDKTQELKRNPSPESKAQDSKPAPLDPKLTAPGEPK